MRAPSPSVPTRHHGSAAATATRPAGPRRRTHTVLAVVALVAATLVGSVPGGAPAAADPADKWRAVSAGNGFTCAVTAVGSAWCWGTDTTGQLGNGILLTGTRYAPSQVDLPGVEFATVTAGEYHACGIDVSGTGWCWGLNSVGQTGNGTSGPSVQAPVQIAGGYGWAVLSAGGTHTCGITLADEAFCWGLDTDGQLGNGATTGFQTTPVSLGSGWADISTGTHHTCGLQGTNLACWGRGANGRLGTADELPRTSPVALEPPADGAWAAVSAGDLHTCGLTGDGVLWCWGNDNAGQLGDGPATTGDQLKAVQVPGTWTSIDAGFRTTCGIDASEVAWCWGSDAQRELGNGPALITNQPSPSLVDLPAGTKFSAISTSTGVTCGLAETGPNKDVRCAGNRVSGSVGDGLTTSFAESPVSIAPAVRGIGELRVTTSPAVPSQIIVDGTPRDVWGLTWMDIEVGEHEVCFSDVVGFVTPPCEVVAVPDGGTGTVVGTFEPLVSLQVSTSPALPGTISVNGVPRDDWGVFSWVPAGEALQVCFGPVADFAPPPCQNVAAGAVQAGVPISLTGTYTPSNGAPGPVGKGFLRVTTSPALPATITVDGEVRDDWGLDWLQVDPGTYEVCFSQILGYATPDCEEVTVAAPGETAAVTGTYPRLGWINAATSPPSEKTITISGVAMNDWGAWPPVAPGSRQVCFIGDVTPPTCKVVVVEAGVTTVVDDT